MTTNTKQFEKASKSFMESAYRNTTKQESNVQRAGVQHAAGNLAVQRMLQDNAQAKRSVDQGEETVSLSSSRRILQHLGAGHPLDASNRALMEARFGSSFSHVRLHTDPQAAESAHMMNAKAFTVGHNIVFGEHQYEPGSASGKRLLAHELAHVIQQHSGKGAAPSLAPNSAVEREADLASQTLNNGQGTITVTQRSGVGVARQMAGRNLSVLSDAELQAEHERVRQWLSQHTMVELDYGPTEDYFREIEEEIARRSTTSTPSLHGPSSQVSSSSVLSPLSVTSSPLQSVAPIASGVVPVGQAIRGTKLAPLSPDELLSYVSSIRGFANSPPGPAPTDPNLVGQPMGKGYQTYAAIQIIDKDGAQVATGAGGYSGGGSEHGEQLSIKAFGENLEALPRNVDVSGGKMIVVVETEPCTGCDSELRAFAQKLGVKEYQVYVPERLSMTTGQPVTAKTAATTVFQGGRPPTTAKLVAAETFEPVPTPSAATEAVPTTPPASVAEPEAASGGLKMVEGSGLPEAQSTGEFTAVSRPPNQISTPETELELSVSRGSQISSISTTIGVNIAAMGLMYLANKVKANLDKQVLEQGLKDLEPKIKNQIAEQKSRIMEMQSRDIQAYANITILVSIYAEQNPPGAPLGYTASTPSVDLIAVNISEKDLSDPGNLTQKTFIGSTLTEQVITYSVKVAVPSAAIDRYLRLKKDLQFYEQQLSNPNLAQEDVTRLSEEKIKLEQQIRSFLAR